MPYNEIKPKRSYSPNRRPLASELTPHELAINWADGRAYTKTETGEILTFSLGGTSSSGGGIAWTAPPVSQLAAGVAGQVAYDASYLYVCVATNMWARIPFPSWGDGAPQGMSLWRAEATDRVYHWSK